MMFSKFRLLTILKNCFIIKTVNNSNGAVDVKKSSVPYFFIC